MPGPAPLFLRVLACLVLGGPAAARAASLVPLSDARVWERLEWRVDGLPASTNPFDPDVIRVDAVVTSPSDRTRRIPAFWHQEYTRKRVLGTEVLEPSGTPEWRLRLTPDEAGTHDLRLEVTLLGRPHTEHAVTTTFKVAAAPRPGATGWVRTAPGQRYLVLDDGRSLPLVGENVCWSGELGTYRFDEWLQAMHDSGQNFARLWFSPWQMGLEHTPGSLTRYDLAAAWQVDRVLEKAGQLGIHVLIAMDHHGMFMASDPAWGGSNNFWTRSSPYAAENGGPCATPNAFFTDPVAHRTYQKRLRYVIARYGFSPHLLSWQFFNEIDNAYLPRSDLVHQDVVEWHRLMGRWLRENDPYQHLVSTSLTGASDRPDFWTLPEMDFTVYHSYGEADPALHVARLSADFFNRYGKPVMIGEIGTNHLRWTLENDPYLRGFRQGLWGGVLGGSVGTSMTWWWEGVHEDAAYPIYQVIRATMERAGWREGEWKPLAFENTGAPPAETGALLEEGDPFNAALPLNQLRLNRVSGEAAITSPLAASRSAERLSSYLHGSRNPQLQQYARVDAWFSEKGRLVFRVDSVAADAEVFVRVDDREVLRVPLADKDGLATLNNEIDREFTVELPPGRHRTVIGHTGPDWINLKSIKLEGVRPSRFPGDVRFTSEAIGLAGPRAAVVYVRSPYVAWPAGALRYNPPTLRGEHVQFSGWHGDGPIRVEWLDPRTGSVVTQTETILTRGHARLEIPDYNDDLLAVLTRSQR